MKHLIAVDDSSVMFPIFIQDASSAVGAGLTGLSAGSAGLTCYYHSIGDTSPTAIPLTNGSVELWSEGGFAQYDATNMPGLYCLSIPNTVFPLSPTAPARPLWTVLYLRGAANMAPCVLEFQVAHEMKLSDYFLKTRLDPTVIPPSSAAEFTVGRSLEMSLALNTFKREQTDNTETVYDIDGLSPMIYSEKSDDGTTFTRGAYRT